VADEVNESGDPDVAKVVRACEERLNPSAEWKPFEGYPGSLALCVLDAIWSVSARYLITRGVIHRYRTQRRFQGNPDEDGLPELLALYDSVGGVDAFIDTVGTRNRVSTQPGAVRKGEAVFRAATRLHDLGVDTAEQFRLADGTPLGEQVRGAWCAVPGQGSGVSWRYLRMLAGLPDVKPDRMVIRFLRQRCMSMRRVSMRIALSLWCGQRPSTSMSISERSITKSGSTRAVSAPATTR
jgi:hypothetical protein